MRGCVWSYVWRDNLGATPRCKMQGGGGGEGGSRLGLWKEVKVGEGSEGVGQGQTCGRIRGIGTGRKPRGHPLPPKWGGGGVEVVGSLVRFRIVSGLGT